MSLSTDLAEFQGAKVSGSVPISEKLLNELANLLFSERQGRIRQADIQIGRDNYLQIGVKIKVGPFYKWFRPEFVIAALNEPRYVVLEIASPEYTRFLWIADLVKERLPQGLTVQNRRLVFDLAGIPAIARFTPQLRWMQITSDRGTLLVSFELRIDS